MTKSQIEKMMAILEKRQKAIGVERDKLDDVIDEMHMLRSNCAEAYDLLERARDVLSELV